MTLIDIAAINDEQKNNAEQYRLLKEDTSTVFNQLLSDIHLKDSDQHLNKFSKIMTRSLEP